MPGSKLVPLCQSKNHLCFTISMSLTFFLFIYFLQNYGHLKKSNHLLFLIRLSGLKDILMWKEIKIFIFLIQNMNFMVNFKVSYKIVTTINYLSKGYWVVGHRFTIMIDQISTYWDGSFLEAREIREEILPEVHYAFQATLSSFVVILLSPVIVWKQSILGGTEARKMRNQ